MRSRLPPRRLRHVTRKRVRALTHNYSDGCTASGMSLREIAAELAARGHLTAYGKPSVRADSRVAAGAFSALRHGPPRRSRPPRAHRQHREATRARQDGEGGISTPFLGGKRAHTPFCRPTTDSDREAHFSRVRSRASNSVSDATSR
jgi:hypothetical protein